MKVPPYTLREVRPRIYLVRFRQQKDLCMFFWRAQEFYESGNPRFRGHAFTLVEHIAWYAGRYGKGYTYPEDWTGFNVPSESIEACDRANCCSPTYDETPYDVEMRALVGRLYKMTGGQPFYLIGVFGKGESLDHEIAHGHFYLDAEHRRRMLDLVGSLPARTRARLAARLRAMGYAGAVVKDEMQAYLATGLSPRHMKDLRKALGRRVRAPFVRSFREQDRSPNSSPDARRRRSA